MEVFYSSLPDTLREVMEENKRKTSTNKDDDVPAIESPPPLVESSDEEEKETAIAYIVEESGKYKNTVAKNIILEDIHARHGSTRRVYGKRKCNIGVCESCVSEQQRRVREDGSSLTYFYSGVPNNETESGIRTQEKGMEESSTSRDNWGIESVQNAKVSSSECWDEAASPDDSTKNGLTPSTGSLPSTTGSCTNQDKVVPQLPQTAPSSECWDDEGPSGAPMGTPSLLPKSQTQLQEDNIKEDESKVCRCVRTIQVCKSEPSSDSTAWEPLAAHDRSPARPTSSATCGENWDEDASSNNTSSTHSPVEKSSGPKEFFFSDMTSDNILARLNL